MVYYVFNKHPQITRKGGTKKALKENNYAGKKIRSSLNKKLSSIE